MGFEGPSYSKGKFAQAEAELKSVNEKKEKASRLGKLFISLREALATNSAKDKVDYYLEEAQTEALQTELKHEQLKVKTENARRFLESALQELANFEEGELGIKKDKTEVG